MNENKSSIAVAYYTAVKNKNMDAIEKFVHPNINFTSPFWKTAGKEAFLQAFKGFVENFKSLCIREVFDSENQGMIVYDVEFSEDIGIVRTAALVTFQEGLVISLEIFFDAHDFKKVK